MTELGDQRSHVGADSTNNLLDTKTKNPTDGQPEFKNFTILEQICEKNRDYFKNDQTEKGQRLYEAFTGLIDHIRNSKVLVEKISSFAHEYDFDENTPGNGYRSFLIVVDGCIVHTTQLAKYVGNNCTKVFFRKGHYTKEIEACNHFLASICTCMEYLLILRSWSPDGDLFGGSHTVEELLQNGDVINQYCFYGRCLGIQYSPTIRGVLRFISICMAGFSESYYSQANPVAKTTSSVWTGGKYLLNPEQRSRRIVNISQCAGVDFCKAFWFLAEGEIMHAIPAIVGSSIKLNKVISIPPEEIHLEHCATGEPVPISVPSSHLGPGPISIRLLSSVIREGMIGEKNTKHMLPPSKNLIVHCHGGGFVAQSSKSHELYLRDWAIALNTPIVSVDYSLAPQAPFPRALEEVFYTYCWAVKNCSSLGSTGERIIMAGDSAGANLSIGCILKCLEFGVRRPDGLFMAYCPVLVDFVPSPARLLCLMDPLLPFGFMMRCLQAYASPNDETVRENKKHSDILEQIRSARDSITMYTLDNSVRSSRKDSRGTVISVENGFWENGSMENGIFSPMSDNASDTFASASYHSQTVENTELMTPDGASSCMSLEDDSQPITKMPDADVNKNTEIPNGRNSVEKNQRESDDNYVSGFLKNYIATPSKEANVNGYPKLQPSLSKTVSEENILSETCKEMITSDSIQSRLNKAAGGIVDAISSKLSVFTNSSEIAGSSQERAENVRNLDSLICRSPSLEFVFQVPKDPYLSPYWAKDEVLAQMPPTSVLTIDMDPCLDDCVMFAKKLNRLSVPVTLDILKGLPHGFLNFTMVSSEAMEGSKVCIQRLAKLLDINIP